MPWRESRAIILTTLLIRREDQAPMNTCIAWCGILMTPTSRHSAVLRVVGARNQRMTNFAEPRVHHARTESAQSLHGDRLAW